MGDCELGAGRHSGPLEEQHPLVAIVISPVPLLKRLPFQFSRTVLAQPLRVRLGKFCVCTCTVENNG